MKAALLIVLSLSALALAGPTTFNNNNNKNNNQIDASINKAQQQQQQQYMTATSNTNGDIKQTQAVETLKQWCFSSQMSQPELTSSFKKLVSMIKSTPTDDSTEAAVMSERICQGALVQKSAQSGETIANNGADAQAHELIKDVYMDALIACESRECMQQLLKIIQSNKVDPIRASYYMTRVAVTEKDSIKDESEIKSFVESFIQQSSDNQQSEAIERQKLFATTSILGKFLKNKCERKDQLGELKQTAEQVAKTIVERYIRPVSQQEVQQYQQQSSQQQQQNKEVAKKIAKRNAALKALANIPGCVLSDIQEVEQVLIELVQNKQELNTVRQSAIECLQHNEKVYKQLKQITFEQEEPIEVRIAAFRTLMTVVWAGKQQSEQTKQQMATEILESIVKHCEESRNQQQDDQFCLYAISYLDNLRTSQKPEHQAIKECISKNKQHYMQIQLLCKKFKQQLNDIRRSSRNYKLEQEFNQLESGLIIEGDLIYESKQQQQQQQQQQQAFNVLPKLVRVNMSMPIMGETVNVVEITLRQNQMDEELLSTLKLVKDVKFNSESVSKVVDSFKSSVEQQQRQSRNSNTQKSAEADLTIKVDGCTVVYVCVDDFKTSSTSQHERNTRSVHSYSSLVDELVEHLKRNPINFNRGFNFNFNERLAKALDVEANIIAGLRFESRASGSLNKDVEIVAKIEPRFAFEAIVGPAKMTSKKLLQRVSTKTAFGLRLRYKNDELVDVQVDLPMNTMELFTFETQMVEKNSHSYTYLPESIYGQEDIYSPEEEFVTGSRQQKWLEDAEEQSTSAVYRQARKMKRSIFDNSNKKSSLVSKFMSSGKSRKIAYSVETPEKIARMVGLRGKLRFVAAPKDMGFLIQAVCQKYEPTMQGYRFQLQKSPSSSRGAEQQQQVVLTVSTPGSRFDRTMQLRAIVQSNSQRTLIKSDIQMPKMQSTMVFELIHDGRQYAIKTELVSVQNNKWRHQFECGVLRNSQQAGRIASSYKPYLNIESSFLKRPIQMQGVISYQQQPKTVISWELKCPTSADFIQGKFIVDSKQAGSYLNKRSSVQTSRRSMRSPVELVFERDLTFTGEMVAQINQHAVKLHKMVDWDSSKLSLAADWTVSHKNLRKSTSNEVVGQLKLNKEQQFVTVQRKCPQSPRSEYRFTVSSETKIPQVHQLTCELRYNGQRRSSGDNLQSIVAYKHKIDIQELSARKVEAQYLIELLANEYQFEEKFTGRTQAHFERKMKTFRTEMSAARSQKQVKLDVEFESIEKHQIEFVIKAERQFQHRTLVRADQRQLTVQSHTEKQGQTLIKIVLDLLKQQQECKIVVECPYKNIHLAADLKLNSGKNSSWAIQTPRFASKAEFSFESMPSSRKSFWKSPSFSTIVPFNQLRFKTDLKDSMKQENYWMDSALNTQSEQGKSYFRLDSPIYRTDLEFDPREQATKFGLFARSKRSIRNNELYSQEESLLNQIFDYAQLKSGNKINLSGDKLWMIRSIISPYTSSSSSPMSELKQKARRALFEYADRRQQSKHQFNWSPVDKRVQFQLEHEPTFESYKPMRFSGDFSLEKEFNNKRPLSLSMESELVDFDVDAKLFDGQESYAKLSALSRHPRSSFKKHESEISYKKQHGYKANMKHVDHENKHHSWELEADESPKKWAKMSMDSGKLGKAHYEHQWRKHVQKKRNNDNNKYADEEEQDVYANKFSFKRESPNKQGWFHQTDLSWDEPIRSAGVYRADDNQRIRRDVLDQVVSEAERRYNTMDYLKHISSARLNSQLSKNQAELYNVDFDYKPYSHARLNLDLPAQELLHSSSFEYQPTERLYKIQSKLMDRRNQKAAYELLAQTKPLVSGLATAEQEPVFIQEQHPMLQRPISNQMALNLFKQPLKLDYSDKYGRVARFDYDFSPSSSTSDKYGLRQKRAAVYYKDDSNDFEHESTYDFYPESLLAGGFKKQHQQQQQQQQQQFNNFQGADFVSKVQTRYGPVSMRAESNGKTVEVSIESPIVNARLTGEQSSSSSKRDVKLYKITLNNKHQTTSLAKIVRKTAILGELEPIVQLAHKLDQTRFEHQSELLVSIVDAIFKIKSQTLKNDRQVMLIEGEFNKQDEKLIVKIDGERTKGQLVADLVSGSAHLVMDVDDKRTFQHQTRLVRQNDKFYSLESMTSYKSKPLFKLQGQISSMVFEEPMHLFARRHPVSLRDEPISTFEATIFESKKVQLSGQFDCVRKEARIVYNDVEDRKVSDVRVRFDVQNNDIKIDARTSTPRGIAYQIQKTIDVTPFVKVY